MSCSRHMSTQWAGAELARGPSPLRGLHPLRAGNPVPCAGRSEGESAGGGLHSPRGAAGDAMSTQRGARAHVVSGWPRFRGCSSGCSRPSHDESHATTAEDALSEALRSRDRGLPRLASGTAESDRARGGASVDELIATGEGFVVAVCDRRRWAPCDTPTVQLDGVVVVRRRLRCASRRYGAEEDALQAIWLDS